MMLKELFLRKKKKEGIKKELDPNLIASFWGIEEKDAAVASGATNIEDAGKRLLTAGIISEELFLAKVSSLFGVEYTLLENGSIEVKDGLFNPEYMRARKFIPFKETDDEIWIAIANPRDLYIVEHIRRKTGKKVKVFLSTEERIESAISKTYGRPEEELQAGINDEDIESLIDLASEAPVIRLVNMLIARAVESGASDIHIEPFEDEVKVRYRIDGILHEVENLPKKMLPAVVSRIKIMARLDIANRRTPQDGRIKTRVGGRELDIRVATLPTIYGEQVVMRLLDQEKEDWNVNKIGLSEQDRRTFLELISASHGMILVTGPTGSGKTTTLYSALKVLNKPGVKIITIEDPVEYVISGVVQIQVNPQAGLTFASGLRSIVRQDPDIIMVGEIRDKETADIAVHAALTGHLVLSTLHTNDAAGAPVRLVDMGVESFLVASALIGVIAQRLVRTICPSCKEETEIPEELRRKFRIEGPVYKGRGCEVCKGSGYLGRTAIYEIMVIDDEIRRAIVRGLDSGEIKKIATSKGMKTLLENGIEKVKHGITTLEEVMRVAHRV